MYHGLSDTQTQVVGTVGNIAAGTVPAILGGAAASGAAAGGSGLILGMAPALAIPVIGAAIAGVTALVSIFMAKNAQYHAQESATTHIVDQAEQLLKQNLAAWNSSSKTASEQAAAIQNFDNIWSQVIQACDRPEFADPGQRCIHDRERGGQWDWFSYYRDPISNDPSVQADPVGGILSGVEQSISSNPIPALVIAGLIAAAVFS